MRMPSAFAGYIAIVVPAALVLFGLVMSALVGWRNWFGLGTKETPKKKPVTGPASPRSKPPPDRT